MSDITVIGNVGKNFILLFESDHHIPKEKLKELADVVTSVTTSAFPKSTCRVLITTPQIKLKQVISDSAITIDSVSFDPNR